MDIISTLSDDLLLKILSELPTKYVVASTILSKRWKNLWTMVQKFDFDDNFELEPSNYGSFLKCVNRSMVFHKAPVLETLKFKVGPCCSYEDITTWITIGMVRGVRELDIRHCNADFKDKKHSLIKLPNSLYTYEKLEVLKLSYAVILDVPIDVCLPSLKSLHLVRVVFKSNQSHRRPLSGLSCS
ncbi:putative F-box domain, leucine-rich repeat domain superfamily, F-box-like domain superfamily [Arabidopsis thaliana]